MSNLDEFLFKFRYPLSIGLTGIIFLGIGVVFVKTGGGIFSTKTKVEVLNSSTESQNNISEIVVEVSGQVEKPGVYKLESGSRIEDVLILAGGFSSSADRVWTEKSLNRAAKLTDGQKIYIPSKTSSSGGGGVVADGLININTASVDQLISLPQIGQERGQSIIEHRPYSNTEELLSKGVLTAGVYEKIKDKISVF
ncbi:MAG: ComEA family DNA-binding protein [bacterium]|nr:ComEA family DNA-binding protein [bacterium]